jgi:hypothetical protein
MNWLKSKAILSGLALMIAALIPIVSSFSDGGDIDWNAAITKFAEGLGLVGIRLKLPAPGVPQ